MRNVLQDGTRNPGDGITHVCPPHLIPKCEWCKGFDPLGGYVEDDETGVGWWECRRCDPANQPPPELPGQQSMDVGDADALEGELV